MPITKSKNFLAEHWLSVARDKNSQAEQFRSALENIASILFLEAINLTTGLNVKRDIKTPLKRTHARFIEQRKIYVVPILRAGLGMLPGIKQLVPEARVAHVGLYRNEYTLQPHWYLDKLPKKISKHSTFFILEPMLATAGTITTVLQRVKSLGASKIFVLSVLMSQHAVEKLSKKFPDVHFFVSGIDPKLNPKGYIMPGLGDAGDRAFNM